MTKLVALALVGWYLMSPPIIRVNGKPSALTSAPLSFWLTERSFDDAASCEAYLRKRSQTYFRFDDDVCIASDDPRLKEK